MSVTYKVLCDDDCVASLEKKEMVTTSSGLQYKDIIEGSGNSPVVGYQVSSGGRETLHECGFLGVPWCTCRVGPAALTVTVDSSGEQRCHMQCPMKKKANHLIA